MNLLFLDAYFEPETTAYSHLEKDLLEALVNKKNNIIVICPIPTRGVSKQVQKVYQSRKYEYLYSGKVKVRRFWAPREGKNPIIRAFRYFWCNLRTYQIASRLKNVHVIFSNSTPPTQGLLSAITAKKLSKRYGQKVPFVYNLQDVFPDSLVNTGLTNRESVLWKTGRKIEDYTYKNADRIIVISDGFKKNIMAKGVSEKKIEVVSNWIDLDSVHPVKREENTLIGEFSINPEKFLVVYAGNFGAAQGADIVLKVAEQLERYKDIQVVIFGGGPYFNEAQREAEKLDNVFIHDLLPQDRISEVYSLGDVALITCKPGTGRAGLPSKTWSIMACNTPIIASFDTDSDLAGIIADSGAGECVEAGNVEKLTEAILQIHNSTACSSDLRGYVQKHADKEHCIKVYRAILNEVVKD